MGSPDRKSASTTTPMRMPADPLTITTSPGARRFLGRQGAAALAFLGQRLQHGAHERAGGVDEVHLAIENGAGERCVLPNPGGA
jgi:hypothetical protein